MAKRPKENQQIECLCPKCNGREIDSSLWYLHNGYVRSGRSFVADEIMAMSKRLKEREDQQKEDT